MTEIVIDNGLRFGKPVVKGTRITVEEVLGALASGMSYEEIEQEYGVKKEDILAVLKYATEIISEEKVGLLNVDK